MLYVAGQVVELHRSSGGVIVGIERFAILAEFDCTPAGVGGIDDTEAATPPMTMDNEATDDLAGTLELHDGSMQVAVYYVLCPDEEGPNGYLRIAFGQGNVVNRLLTSVGARGRILQEEGEALPVLILSADASEAPGYLCAFAVLSDADQAELPRAA